MLEDVTIGIPVYNEEAHIAQAIESAIKQNCRILISDNASMDHTESICREYSARNSSISYIRHPANMGGLANALYCLDNAKTKYFMWLGGHDYLDDEYCEQLYNALQASKDGCLAFASVTHIDRVGAILRKHEYNELTWGISSRWVNDRVQVIICDMLDWTLVQGLYLAETLRKNVPRVPVAGPDDITLARTALCGRLIYCGGTTYFCRKIREVDDQAGYMLRIAGRADCPYNRRLMCDELFDVVMRTPVQKATRRIRFARDCMLFMSQKHSWRIPDRTRFLLYLLRGPGT